MSRAAIASWRKRDRTAQRRRIRGAPAERRRRDRGFRQARDEIERQLLEAAKREGGSLGEHAELLDEVTAWWSCERLCGAIRPGVPRVPQECLILTMRQNQKYSRCSTRREAPAEVPHRLEHEARRPARDRRGTSAWCGRGSRMRASSTTRTARSGSKRACRSSPRCLPQPARQPARARRAHPAPGRQHRARLESRRAARRARGVAVESRPAHRHGGRVPRAAGFMGAITRYMMASRAKWHAIEAHYRPRFAAIIFQTHDFLLGRRATSSMRCWAVRYWTGSHRRAIPSACAARRWAWFASWSSAAGAVAVRARKARRRRELHLERARLFPGARLLGGEVDSVLSLRPHAWIWCRGSCRPCGRSPPCPRPRACRGEQADRQHLEAGRDRAAGFDIALMVLPRRKHWRAPSSCCSPPWMAHCARSITRRAEAIGVPQAPVDAFFDK